ncbi:MAG: hypothetical protein H0W64_04885 [Gammaproteobacteria bacterium]|nr:hypothetical protein [Gammaproteobacteria bacterium]
MLEQEMDKKTLEWMREALPYGLLTEDLLKKFYCILQNPELLTNEHIHLIGQAYLERYPKKTGYVDKLFSWHTNHDLAQKLVHLNGADAYGRWLSLSNAISYLPKTSGKLANTILILHLWAFGDKFDPYNLRKGVVDRLAENWNARFIYTYPLSDAMRESVKSYYADMYHDKQIINSKV